MIYKKSSLRWSLSLLEQRWQYHWYGLYGMQGHFIEMWAFTAIIIIRLIKLQLRIIFAACVMQSTAIFISRPALIYAQYSDSAGAEIIVCPNNDNHILDNSLCLLPFAIAQIQSFAYFSIMYGYFFGNPLLTSCFRMTGLTCERLVATFFWEWWEQWR